MEEYRSVFFEGLPAKALGRLLSQLERRQFPAGATVLAQGNPSGEMYLIQSGTALVSIGNHQGQEHVLTRVGPGATLGEMSLLTGDPISATVRAAPDAALEVLVLTADDFHRVAAAFPQIYRNLAAILSERLARTNQHALRPYQERLTFLLDAAAPPLLGYALACSLAWHTRRSTLLLVLADPTTAAEELTSLASGEAGAAITSYTHRLSGRFTLPAPVKGRASLLLAAPNDSFAPSVLGETVEVLCSQYDQVLVQVSAAEPPIAAARSLRLTGALLVSGAAPAADPGLTLRAWVETGGLTHPDERGMLTIPRLTQADEAALRQGRLAPTTPAGRTLGWAARDLAKLKVGLALGAGAAKGYAHIGVLRVLERAGVPIDYLAGTSVGAVVAALHALGYSPDRAAEVLDDVGAAAFRLTLPIKALLSSAGLRARTRQIAGNRRIEDLPVPLALVAADLITGQEVVFRRGLLWAAVLASMALPGIYPPQRLGPYTLVDGGVLNPVPGDVVSEMGADLVLAVKLSSHEPTARAQVEAGEMVSGGPSVMQTMLRSIEAMQSTFSARAAATATVMIEPILEGSSGKGLRHFSQGRRFIPLGEAAAEEALPRLAALLPWLGE